MNRRSSGSTAPQATVAFRHGVVIQGTAYGCGSDATDAVLPGHTPDIHSQGTAPRLFNHPGQRLRSAVITGTTPGIPVDQQHQVIVFFTFALPKLPGPDVMQGCGMHAFTFPMLTFLVSVDSGFQGIDEPWQCLPVVRQQVSP